ncbi:endophilin-A2-like [Centruroides sculpturatus]|uniref:endophilin-A2-like n=1 Tax=Centruroides sculpturatus TaxID=218467 RepID=UPI000C6E09C8|nr:endophilin-A2-like [Centruroides sculpturatus]
MLKALYDFEGQSTEEISFKEGDILHFESKLSNDWWKGSINGQKGIFPACFVEVISNKRSSCSEEKSKVCLVTAVYQFDGEEEGDLSFKVKINL